MSTHNIYFYVEIWKIIPELLSNTHHICFTVKVCLFALDEEIYIL